MSLMDAHQLPTRVGEGCVRSLLSDLDPEILATGHLAFHQKNSHLTFKVQLSISPRSRPQMTPDRLITDPSHPAGSRTLAFSEI